VREITQIAGNITFRAHGCGSGVGKFLWDVEELGVDFLTVAGHKLDGPKGVEALFMKQGRDLTPLIHGGGQEKGEAVGTENTILNSRPWSRVPDCPG